MYTLYDRITKQIIKFKTYDELLKYADRITNEFYNNNNNYYGIIKLNKFSDCYYLEKYQD